MVTVNVQTFYKVLIIAVGIYESNIIDEQHFKTIADAQEYADTHTSSDAVSVIVAV